MLGPGSARTQRAPRSSVFFVWIVEQLILCLFGSRSDSVSCGEAWRLTPESERPTGCLRFLRFLRYDPLHQGSACHYPPLDLHLKGRGGAIMRARATDLVRGSVPLISPEIFTTFEPSSLDQYLTWLHGRGFENIPGFKDLMTQHLIAESGTNSDRSMPSYCDGIH